MARTKIRELPGKIQHLPKYKPAPKDQITHSVLWERALGRWEPRTTVWVEFLKK